MDDLFKPPESNLEIDREQRVLEKLAREESYLISLIAAAVATVVGILFLADFANRVPLLVFLLPALFAGFATKFLGRPVGLGCRFAASLACGSILFFALSHEGANAMSLSVAFLGILVCLAVSRRSLSLEQERALYRRRHNIEIR
ncbi:hypothetical protein [Microbulbifer hainanensis]|uniref:hypothetical protein n=1 Tax=Microbulbifer hainanensis TaxID=2735675 RepID=UPI00186787FD|nr:hypothetical protein [Microbulbifer hainanensis]